MKLIGPMIAGTVFLFACANEPVTTPPQSGVVVPAPEAAPLTGAASSETNAHDTKVTATKPSAATPATLTRVDPSLVCMVNNHFMGKAQIPVEVEGKTYFGCCEMCKGRLAKDPSSRAAKDPVSGVTVDKAVAVIARDNSGGVVYFENEANLAQYAAR